MAPIQRVLGGAFYLGVPLAGLRRPFFWLAPSRALGGCFGLIKCLGYSIHRSLGFLVKNMPRELGPIWAHIKEAAVIAYCVFNHRPHSTR